MGYTVRKTLSYSLVIHYLRACKNTFISNTNNTIEAIPKPGIKKAE